MMRAVFLIALLLLGAGCISPGEDYGHPYIIKDYTVDAERFVSLNVKRRQGPAIVTERDAADFIEKKLPRPGLVLTPVFHGAIIQGDRTFLFVLLKAGKAPSALEPGERLRLEVLAMRMDRAVVTETLRGAF